MTNDAQQWWEEQGQNLDLQFRCNEVRQEFIECINELRRIVDDNISDSPNFDKIMEMIDDLENRSEILL